QMSTPAAIVDVGSNTIRLLVGRAGDGCVVRVYTEGSRVGLGREIEASGAISEAKIEEAATVVARLCRAARAKGAESGDGLGTAPGRQAANAERLLEAVGRAAKQEPQVLSREDEGRLAFAGAVAAAPTDAKVVAVVDLGGASTEVAVGRPEAGAVWIRSFDI